VYEHPNVLQTTGRDTLAAQYGPMLRQATNLHATFQYHTTIGDKVVVHETIHGLPNRDAPLSQVVLYRVTDGHIDRAWLVQD